MSGRWDGTERRRSPREPLAHPAECRIVMGARVRLLDLSAKGALLTSDSYLPLGAVGQMITALVSGHFAPLVQILRNHPGRHEDRRELGVSFQSMDADSRQRLEAFLNRARR